MPRRIALSPLIASPLLFGVPVALGVIISTIRLVQLRYPDLEWATTVNSDAEQLYLGHTLYQSPAHGYTGQIYTPGFPAMVSLFDRLYLWNGWPMVLVILASVLLAGLAARIAYTRVGPAPRLVAILGAAGIGGIAYWCVASVHLSLLDEARCDQVAWAFALFGLIAVADLGATPSRRRVVVAALLLSAALWTKQTTVAAVGPAVVWVIGLACLSALNRRSALLFCAVLGGVNLMVLLVLNLLTHGWEFYVNFEMATNQAVEKPFEGNLRAGLDNGALAAGFVAVTWLSSVVYAATHWRRRSRRPPARDRVANLRRLLAAEDSTSRRVLLLGIYIVVGFLLAGYFMRKQGTDTNQLIGVAWALGLLAAMGWRVAQRHVGAAAVAGGCVAVFFVLVQTGPIGEMAAKADVTIPTFEEKVDWASIPEELRLWAGNHTLYAPIDSDLNVASGGPLYPNFFNFADVLASGNQPLYLVRALLNRRFDGVSLLPTMYDPYTSGFGKWEENYVWKLDEVILARYMTMPGLPEGVLGRRPGPEPAAWMRHCFGPFAGGGVSFRIHHGGGFWCSFSPEHLSLVRTPATTSEVVSTQPVQVGGTVTVGLKDWATTRVNLEVQGGSGARWVASVGAAPGSSREVLVSTYLGKTLLGSQRVPAANLTGGLRGVRLGLQPTSARPGRPISSAAGAATLTAPRMKAPFALVATDGAVIDLQAMRLEH